MVILCQTMVSATIAGNKFKKYESRIKSSPLLHKHQSGSFWF